MSVVVVIISALELKVNKQKKGICHLVPKFFDFSHHSAVPFNQVGLYSSISCAMLRIFCP